MRLADLQIVTTGFAGVLQLACSKEILGGAAAVGTFHALAGGVGNDTILLNGGQLHIGDLALGTCKCW